MSQIIKINSINKSKGVGSSFTAQFLYDNLEQKIVEAFISSDSGMLNGVQFEEGSLVCYVKEYGTTFYLGINVDGDLILSAEDAEQYSIDANGDLIYTKDDMTTVNLGFVKSIHSGTTAPANTQMIWYDTNPGQLIHKYYKTLTSTWVQLGT